MDISVVVPLYDEVESLPELTSWISRVMNENHFTEAAYSTQPASKASPNATPQAYHAARDSQADAPASKSAPDDAPHAKTCKQTWSRQPAKFVPNSREKIL